MNTSKTTHFHPAHRVASLLAVSALALGLAACSKTEEPTVGQRLDSAVEKTEQAAADARARAEKIAKASDCSLGSLKSSDLGVFQITGEGNNEEYSWGGVFNTSSKRKTARVTVSSSYSAN